MPIASRAIRHAFREAPCSYTKVKSPRRSESRPRSPSLSRILESLLFGRGGLDTRGRLAQILCKEKDEFGNSGLIRIQRSARKTQCRKAKTPAKSGGDPKPSSLMSGRQKPHN